MTALDRKINDLDERLKGTVEATGTRLTDIVGVGIVTAAVILGETGEVRRFPGSLTHCSATSSSGRRGGAARVHAPTTGREAHATWQSARRRGPS